MSLTLLRSAARTDAVARLKDRDLAAWDDLVESEHGRIFNLHLRLTGDREAAADLTQETFVAAYESVDTFRGRGQPEAWLYGVALNCNRSWWRKTGRSEPPNEPNEDLADPEPTAEELAELRERSDLIYAAVQRLPESYRRVVALRYFGGFSSADIARCERVREGTVRWRLHRALQRLWVILQPQIGADQCASREPIDCQKESENETGANGELRIAP